MFAHVHLLSLQQTLLNDTQKQTDKGKDDVKSQYIKLSWAQNKLKAETEAHKESKKKLEDTSKQLATVQQEMDKLQKEHDKTVTEVQVSLLVSISYFFVVQLALDACLFSAVSRALFFLLHCDLLATHKPLPCITYDMAAMVFP